MGEHKAQKEWFDVIFDKMGLLQHTNTPYKFSLLNDSGSLKEDLNQLGLTAL